MIDKKYIAGFIDGEGSIALYKHKDIRVKKGYTLHPMFDIVNTNLEVLKAINNLVNGKIKYKTKQIGCKQVYLIQLQDYKQIKSILEILLPYLIVKKKQAELMIEFCNSRLKSNGKKYSERDYKIVDLFSKLNKRGEGSKDLGILPNFI
jgi:hypothetical protein